MAWRDRLREASYKGVPFFYEEVTSRIGRNTQVTKIPFRRKPHVEDLGEMPTRFRVRAYVLGADYDVERDKMSRAILSDRDGLLVHPYWGNRHCRVEGEVAITETTREGGMAWFDITFVDVTDDGVPFRRIDFEARVKSKASLATQAARDVFAATHTVSGKVSDVRTAATSNVLAVTSVIRNVKHSIDQAVGVEDDVYRAIDDLSDAAESLVNIPADLASEIVTVMEKVVASITDTANRVTNYPDRLTAPFLGPDTSSPDQAKALMRMFRALDTFDNDFPDLSLTSSGLQVTLIANQEALTNLVRTALTCETSRAAATLTFDSFDQAIEVRNELSEAIEALLADAGDDVFSRLWDLRAALGNRLTDVAATLPRVLELTLTGAVPALVLAQRLYGDATRDQEIIDRNSLRNPASIPGGTVLKVLSE